MEDTIELSFIYSSLLLLHTKSFNLGLMATCEDMKFEKIMASFVFNKHLWITHTDYGIVP